MQITGVSVFSATTFAARADLGARVTKWMEENRDKTIVDKVVTQSSDSDYHCIAITLFWHVDDKLSATIEVATDDLAAAQTAKYSKEIIHGRKGSRR